MTSASYAFSQHCCTQDHEYWLIHMYISGKDSIAKRIRVFVEKVFSCHIYFTRYEHFPAGFWHTFITPKVNNTERLVGVLAVCSGGQSPLNISRVPFHELFHGANSGTCSHTGKTGSERQMEPTKIHVLFSYFDSNASVYSPKHALKYHLTVQRE